MDTLQTVDNRVPVLIKIHFCQHFKLITFLVNDILRIPRECQGSSETGAILWGILASLLISVRIVRIYAKAISGTSNKKNSFNLAAIFNSAKVDISVGRNTAKRENRLKAGELLCEL